MTVSNLLNLQSTLETSSEPERRKTTRDQPQLLVPSPLLLVLPEAALFRKDSLVSSSHDQQALLLRQGIPRKLLKSLVLLENPRDLGRQVVKTIDDRPTSLLLGESVVRELDGHHDESDVLGSVGLRNEEQE